LSSCFGLNLGLGHKKPAGGVAGGLVCFFSDLSGRLHQAMKVRRHGLSMMMVTVMAVDLHLVQR